MPDLAEKNFREMLASAPAGGQDFVALGQYGLARVAGINGKLEEARRLGGESAITLELIGHRSTQEVKNWLSSLQ